MVPLTLIATSEINDVALASGEVSFVFRFLSCHFPHDFIQLLRWRYGFYFFHQLSVVPVDILKLLKFVIFYVLRKICPCELEFIG